MVLRRAHTIVRSIFTWLFGVAISGILLAVIAAFFTEVARDKGMFQNAGMRWDAYIDMIAEFAKSAWVLYPVGGLGVFVAGLWIGRWGITPKRTPPLNLSHPNGAEDPRTPSPALPEPSLRLSSSDFETFTSALGEIDTFLATDVEQVVQNGRQIGNWRKLQGSGWHADFMRHLTSVRAEKDGVANELRLLLQRHKSSLDLLALDLSEVPQSLDRWHAPIQELFGIAQHLSDMPRNALDRILNPKVSDVSKAVGETVMLVSSKREEITRKRRGLTIA